MLTIFYYVSVVLIWGTTWIAVKHQVIHLAVEQAIFYRFFLAAVILLAGLKILNRLKPINRSVQLLCMGQGACLFCLNFYAFYTAAEVLTSGLLAVIFSTTIVMNAFNNWLWFSQPPTMRVLLAALLGLIGMLMMFYHDLYLGDNRWQSLIAIGLAVLGSYCFSTGNMLSLIVKKHQPDLLTTTAWSLFYGASFCLLLVVLFAEPSGFEWHLGSLISLLYLVLFGTLIVFLMYLQLVRMIGVDRVAYTTVMMPVVALVVSTIFEGYQWNIMELLGLALILLGNLLVFQRLPVRSS